MVRMGTNGRMVIPARFREAMELAPGDEMILRLVDGELRLSTVEVAIRNAQAVVRRHVPDGVNLVEELIADRRDAATRE